MQMAIHPFLDAAGQVAIASAHVTAKACVEALHRHRPMETLAWVEQLLPKTSAQLQRQLKALVSLPTTPRTPHRSLARVIQEGRRSVLKRLSGRSPAAGETARV